MEMLCYDIFSQHKITLVFLNRSIYEFITMCYSSYYKQQNNVQLYLRYTTIHYNVNVY